MARPILSQQRRLARIGTIRAGEKGAKGPSKLETWRLTSSSLPTLQAAAALYGGEPREWSDDSSDERYELYTTTDRIPVAWAPGVCSWTSQYEFWSRAGRTRLCDGVTVSVIDPETGEVDQRPCMCDGSGKDECRPATRVSFILPELPGLGVWLLTTRSDYAAREMPGALDILEQLMESRRPVGATLVLAQRTTKKPGERYPRRYAVPVLDLDVSVSQLMSGQAPADVPALPAGGADGEGPDTSPSLEAPGAAPVEPPAPPENKSDGPELGTSAEVPSQVEDPDPPLTEGQRRKLFAEAARIGVERDRVRELAREHLGHGVSEMLQSERGALWEAVQAESRKTALDPPKGATWRGDPDDPRDEPDEPIPGQETLT